MKIKVGSDFSGVGAFDQALIKLGIDYETVFACDIDKYARQTYVLNYGEPEYFPKDVYEREIPEDPLDIYMTSPPCQAFSLAGKRKGEDDTRGILFYNSHEFIKKNKPRYFIFENVKGLLSDDGGRTFQRWVDFLGGKSVNGTPLLFPLEQSVPYHIYYKVLNAKDYGVPQNRERVFIIGIRDGQDNTFRWSKPFHLEKRLKDVLEDEVDEKYFLSESAINSIILNEKNLQKSKVNPDIANALQTPGNACGVYKGMNAVTNFQGKDISNFIRTGGKLSLTDKHNWDIVKINSATKKGYEVAKIGDSINFSQPNSETRRGRVGKRVAQTLETSCNQGVIIGAFRGRNPDNPKSRKAGDNYEQTLEINKEGISNTLSTVQKDNVVIQENICIADYISDEGLRIRKDNNSPIMFIR